MNEKYKLVLVWHPSCLIDSKGLRFKPAGGVKYDSNKLWTNPKNQQTLGKLEKLFNKL